MQIYEYFYSITLPHQGFNVVEKTVAPRNTRPYFPELRPGNISHISFRRNIIILKLLT